MVVPRGARGARGTTRTHGAKPLRPEPDSVEYRSLAVLISGDSGGRCASPREKPLAFLFPMPTGPTGDEHHRRWDLDSRAGLTTVIDQGVPV